uniref:Protein eyes shut n=1 Tax=Zeugodacus cucurbitae TaxID=28588 RepID=A0A0A1X0S4_ZEUCU
MTKKRRLPTRQLLTTRNSALPRRTPGAAASQAAVSIVSSNMRSAAAMTSMDNVRTSSNKNNNNNDSIRCIHNNNTITPSNGGDNMESGRDQRRSENAHSKSQSYVNCASVMSAISNENIGRRQACCLAATDANKMPCGKYQRSEAMQACEGNALQALTAGSQKVQQQRGSNNKLCNNNKLYNNNIKNALATQSALQHVIFKATLSTIAAPQCQSAVKAATTTAAKVIKGNCKPVAKQMTSSTTRNVSAADNTKRTRKLSKTTVECPSVITAQASATPAPANSLSPTKTSAAKLTNTYAPTALSTTKITTTRIAANLWSTLRQQALVIFEDFVRCRSSNHAANGVMKNNNNNSSGGIANGFVWLLPVLCLLAAFGCGQAGFACLSNPCVFGVCIDGLNSSSYSCYCIDGYTGIQCQTNWDECWSGPCQNGGTCIDGVAYYNCTCPDGFTGINCEENVDECMSNPCQNGGHCRDRNNGYTCTCQPGYLGINCEIDVAVCETGTGARCQNGGECIEGPGLEFSCECTAGWHGRICQEEINECESAPCQNGGVCVDKLASYVCACPMGYTGNNCEEEILICADNPCQNNALCLMEESIPTCYCVPDYHGEKCEYQYDECQLGPRCMNGGVCIDGVDTFSCSCPPLLTGMLCECLMIGEDSLDCNYTVSISTMPPTTIIRPITPTAAATVTTTTPTEVTPHVSAVPVVTTTTAAPSGTASVSTSVETEETEEETGVGVGAEKTKAPPETATATGSAVSISSEEKPQTTESSRSYTAESGSSVESSYSSEGSASVEVGTSDELTTPSHVDASSAEEGVPTTAKTTISTADSDYTPGSSAVSKSAESDEGPPITYSTRPPFKHYVTTIETTFSIDYSTARPTSLRPKPTIFFPSSTVHILPELPGKHIPTEYTEYPDHDVTSPHRITTTAAPFFTEYPEVAVTTRYKDFTSKDLSMVTTGRPITYPTTLSSLTPTIVRIGTTLHPQLGGEAASSTVTPATGVTAERPDGHHHHHHHLMHPGAATAY